MSCLEIFSSTALCFSLSCQSRCTNTRRCCSKWFIWLCSISWSLISVNSVESIILLISLIMFSVSWTWSFMSSSCLALLSLSSWSISTNASLLSCFSGDMDTEITLVLLNEVLLESPRTPNLVFKSRISCRNFISSVFFSFINCSINFMSCNTCEPSLKFCEWPTPLAKEDPFMRFFSLSFSLLSLSFSSCNCSMVLWPSVVYLPLDFSISSRNFR